jgi:hypothetical protein
VLPVQAKGADVNGKVFRGYPATAAAREGRAEVAELLVRAGASQPACEQAVVEAALQGQAALAAIFMGSDLVRPRVAVHALVSAAARGFVDVVDTLIKVHCLLRRSLYILRTVYLRCIYFLGRNEVSGGHVVWAEEVGLSYGQSHCVQKQRSTFLICHNLLNFA